MTESNNAPFRKGIAWGLGASVLVLIAGAVLLVRSERSLSELPAASASGSDSEPSESESDLPRMRRIGERGERSESGRERQARLKRAFRRMVDEVPEFPDAGASDPALDREPYARWREQNEASLDAAGRIRALRQVKRNIDRLNLRIGEAQGSGHTERVRLMRSRLKFLEERRVKLESEQE